MYQTGASTRLTTEFGMGTQKGLAIQSDSQTSEGWSCPWRGDLPHSKVFTKTLQREHHTPLRGWASSLLAPSFFRWHFLHRLIDL